MPPNCENKGKFDFNVFVINRSEAISEDTIMNIDIKGRLPQMQTFQISM